MISGAGTTRLLPWSTPEGKPCYVVGDGTGYVSRVADRVERSQLGMAAELLDDAADMLGDREVTPVQFRLLAARLAGALRDVCRIAESRGARLPEPVYGDGDPAPPLPVI